MTAAEQAGQGVLGEALPIDLDSAGSQPPLLTIVGGKLTTYRRLAEGVLDRLTPFLTIGKKWTAGASLPGGNFPADGLPDLVRALVREDGPERELAAWMAALQEL